MAHREPPRVLSGAKYNPWAGQQQAAIVTLGEPSPNSTLFQRDNSGLLNYLPPERCDLCCCCSPKIMLVYNNVDPTYNSC
jgi:hypothetical protein